MSYLTAKEDTDWDNVVWASLVDKEMVAHLDPGTVQELTDELDDAVARVCEAYEIG